MGTISYDVRYDVRGFNPCILADQSHGLIFDTETCWNWPPW